MAHLKIDIKGRQWTFILMPDKRFDRLHNHESEENIAMTIPSTYEVHYRKSDWNPNTIRHELLHVLFSMSLVGSAELEATQVQETCAEIVGEHSHEIILWADRITEKFLGRE